MSTCKTLYLFFHMFMPVPWRTCSKTPCKNEVSESNGYICFSCFLHIKQNPTIGKPTVLCKKCSTRLPHYCSYHCFPKFIPFVSANAIGQSCSVPKNCTCLMCNKETPSTKPKPTPTIRNHQPYYFLSLFLLTISILFLYFQ